MYKIDYEFNEDIIKVELIDTLDLEEIESLLVDLYRNLDKKKICLLTDARKVNYKFRDSDFDIIVEMTKKYIEKIDFKIFEAIIINSPLETAISMLFLKIRGRFSNFDLKHEVKIFYTEQAAVRWLLVNRRKSLSI